MFAGFLYSNVVNAREFFARILDIVLPRKDRVVRAETLALEHVPVMPAARQLHDHTLVSLMEYRNPDVEALIQSLKYDRSTRAAQILADMLADYLASGSEDAAFGDVPIILVPVPLHVWRKRERGFNQVERILERLPEQCKNGNRARVETLLERVRATPPQTRLSRTERLQNIKGAFAIKKGVCIPDGVRALIIDDVTTTGATLTEAITTLKRAGIEAEGLALARA